jgi:bifunctional N-acetylglucosamine-1-phosphate-uridyltransferase/glucosamine-1-phosphate-acetyltransferase GlmU-like protein
MCVRVLELPARTIISARQIINYCLYTDSSLGDEVTLHSFISSRPQHHILDVGQVGENCNVKGAAYDSAGKKSDHLVLSHQYISRKQ